MSIATMGNNGYVGLSEVQQTDLSYRSPSIRREPKISGNNLRTLYQSSESHAGSQSEVELGLAIDATAPILPLTPPNIEGEEPDADPSSSDTTRMRSVLVTPVNNLSPPTPDITPPREHHARPFLGARPSMASTYAESFKTAQEDISSNIGSSLSLPISRKAPTYQHSPALPVLHHSEHKPSPLVQTFYYEGDVPEPSLTWKPPHMTQRQSGDRNESNRPASEENYDDSPILPAELFPSVVQDVQPPTRVESEAKSVSPQHPTRKGPSLKERLEESHKLPRSRSLDKFANIIGWNEAVQAGDNKRWSGVSTSTISAIVVDQPQVSKRRGTLRHVGKKESLRSTSSPLPPSNRPLSLATSDSPHQLTHKKARLSNRHRESFSSDRSRPISLSSSMPVRKMEIIKVAVIPERVSSLQDSASETRQRSRSVSTGTTTRHRRRGSESYVIQHARDHLPVDANDRGRDRYYPPQVGPFTVPVRSSSLSAPTSRTTSRANSLTSESIRSARKQAENDLRNTLNRMESDRLALSLQTLTREPSKMIENQIVAGPSNNLEIKAHDFAAGAERNAEQDLQDPTRWTDVRPPSFINTLHSAPSFLSASPEINEAKVVSFFPHNNHSIQVIEPFPLSDSKAVQFMRQQDSGRLRDGSPFRDPRTAPTPPRTTISSNAENSLKLSSTAASTVINPTSESQRPRPARVPTRADSFARTLMHTVSLRNARNKKANQDLDAATHPMWRPRPFWEDADAQKRRDEEREQQQQSHDRGLVQNSVGIPQQRSGFGGPIALMHRISNRRRNRKAVVKQSSFTSLHRLRTGRRLYRIPGLGVHLQMLNLKDFQGRIAAKRLRREEQRQEQRQDELRKTIGANVISMGDSRFPAHFV